MKFDSKLAKRGILQTAILAQWEAESHKHNSGWSYPVFDLQGQKIGKRWKAQDSKANPKYLWLPEKPENTDTDWYILPDTSKAIAAAKGTAYLANGEPALLAYHAAGIHNVIATTLSEVAVPKNPFEYLKKAGIRKLLYPIDNDAAGQRSALNWMLALENSGIEFQAYEWGADAPAKADANDIWIQVAFEKVDFQNYLSSLAPYFPQRPAPTPALSIPRNPAFDFESIHGKLLDAVQNALSAQGNFTGKRFNGAWLQMACIYHEDTVASAGFNIETGVINCFGCGAKHSLTRNAERLGIDWKRFIDKPAKSGTSKKAQKGLNLNAAPIDDKSGMDKPAKSEKKAYKAVKPDFSEYEAALEALEKERASKSYEQIIAEDLHWRRFAWETKQYESWFATERVPFGVLSALLHLGNGRSNTPLIFARLHVAVKTGKLPSFFTIAQAEAVLDMPLISIKNALVELEQLNFISKLRTSNIDTRDSNIENSPKLSIENTDAPKGRRPVLYLIALENADWMKSLRDKLEIHFRERLINRAISRKTGDMGLNLNLEDGAFELWQKRSETAQKEKGNAAANAAFEKEFYGDGGNWRGWENALKSPYSLPIDYDACVGSHELRIAIIRHWVGKVRKINSRDELKRLLGCSDPMIDKLMYDANIASEKRDMRLDLPLPPTVKGMASLYNQMQREHSGKVWKISYRLKDHAKNKDSDKWIKAEEWDYLKIYAENAGKIDRVFMLLTIPSEQHLMTAEEITARAAAEEQAKADAAAELKQEQFLAGEANKETESPAPESEQESSKEKPAARYPRRYKEAYSYAWIYNQIRLEVHCFSDYVLSDHTILDKDANQVYSGSLAGLIHWLNENAAAKPKRSCASFFGKEYDEEQDLKSLQAIAEAHIAAISEQYAAEGTDESEDDISQMAIWGML